MEHLEIKLRAVFEALKRCWAVTSAFQSVQQEVGGLRADIGQQRMTGWLGFGHTRFVTVWAPFDIRM